MQTTSKLRLEHQRQDRARFPASPGGTRLHRKTTQVAVALLATVAFGLPWASHAQEGTTATSEPAFTDVGRLAVEPGIVPGEEPVSAGEAQQSGWLILNRKLRRGYVVFETAAKTTIVRSYDLDTLAPRRRVTLRGLPIYAGPRAAASAGVTNGYAGEIVHAVDEEAGRLYLALTDNSETGVYGHVAGIAVSSASQSPDGNRPVARYVAIDEEAFDQGRSPFAASFAEQPNWPLGWLRSLVVDRTRTTEGVDAFGKTRSFGRLASVITLPNASSLPPATHQLRQWDVSDLTLGEAAVRENTGLTPPDVNTGGVALSVCSASSMTTGTAGSGSYQWGLLMAADGAYLGCQGGNESSRAAFVQLHPDGSSTGTQHAFPLSRPVSDVLVDHGNGRLLFGSIAGTSRTWWVFDAAAKRFMGALVATLGTGGYSAGLDSRTGRLYMLVPDYTVVEEGRAFGVRGGLHTADTRLDPVPAAENVDPALAYPAVVRIQVDTHPHTGVTRVFVRRGRFSQTLRVVYPGTQPTEPSEVEPFFRVLRDDRPVPAAAAEDPEADRRFTTNVAEVDGVTKASYQASGSGYGSRALLVGGLGAATSPSLADLLVPDCNKDDRELLAGQVESAALSDVSASATAASLAADPATEAQAGTLPAECRQADAAHMPNSAELDFDADDDGESEYRIGCTGDDGRREQAPIAGRTVSRSAFTSYADCDQEGAIVRAGGAAAAVLPGAGPPATVGYSQSTVTVERREEGGVVVKVDSIARDLDIALGERTGHIGVVRAEATSAAAGRDGTAKATFTRQVCGVDIPGVLTQPQCLSESTLGELEAKFKERFSGQAEIRFRKPDTRLLEGSISGFRSGVQRQQADLFQDARISKDTSLAVPGLELVFFQGDSSLYGAGRQILHLAGVQASTSYGIACLHGAGARGGCATGSGGEAPLDPDMPTVGPDGGLVHPDDGDSSSDSRNGRSGGRSLVKTLTDLIKAPFTIAADVLRLLFANPREFGLMAAVWALLYLPCYLGERRRTLEKLAARRVAA